ncbi:hypothetical protein [Algoriphagus sp. A40]|uniref:hypothetical protein n=1 Tax=Algoriphagus sp. A40 TaxID=1945863 RepID=UPI0009856B39|nr:hypothetical protein [Algoriphagus sp. A40]OOG78549.1 hypothetical protein B0E43_01265 [Algoriphagus sp. A40]
MKLFRIFILICFSFLAGCSDLEDPSVQEPTDEQLILLRNVLSGPLDTPDGKLKSESFYYGPETLQYRTDFYYDTQGRELLRVTIPDQDTAGVYLNEYLADGKLDQTVVYIPGPEGFVFVHYFKRFYENNDQTINVMQGRDGNYSQYAHYKFDQHGRKISYRRGTETLFDLHEYYYETGQSTQIMEEHYRQSGMTEPFYRYRYDYDGRNFLIAKSLQLLGPEFRPAFEYGYDENGNLIEEITNYLYLGTVPTERKTFEYY